MSQPEKVQRRIPAPPTADKGARRHTIVAVPTGWLIALMAALVLPWLAVGGIYFAREGAPAPAPAADSLQLAPAAPARPGPWGHLTVTPIVVSPPIEYVAADWGRVTQGEWRFPGVSRDLLDAFLVSSGFSRDQIAQLVARAQPDQRTGGLIISPDLTFVRAMTSEQRERLYTQLGKTTANPDQSNAFSFHGASVDEWLGGSTISKETRELIEPLIYRHGDFLYFADAALVQSLIADPGEKQRLAKVLLRQKTMLVTMTVRDASEVDALAEYWGRGGRATDIRPLLESVAGTPGERSIDIVHLLPAFARNYLYRYPKLTTGDLEKPLLANCLWSALNFFRQNPDDRFLDVATAIATLRKDYYVVENSFRLGDIIALLDPEGNLFHVAVYLADDLVFTKNGTSPVSPWIIMPLERLKEVYTNRAARPRMIVHRRSDL